MSGDSFTDTCAGCGCGGTLGYRRDRTGLLTHIWHEGTEGRRSEPIADDWIVRPRRARQIHLLAFAERCHKRDRDELERREREEIMADPTRWPDIIDKEIVVTGKLERYDRVGIERAITLAGGRNADKVTYGTDLLVKAVRPGTVKVRDAARHNIPTIGDVAFMALLERSQKVRERRDFERSQGYIAGKNSAKVATITTTTNTINTPIPAGPGRMLVDGKPTGPIENFTLVGTEARTGRPVYLRDSDGKAVIAVDGGLVEPDTSVVNVKTSTDRFGDVTYEMFRSSRQYADKTPAPPVAQPPTRRPAGPTLDELINRERYRRSERD